MKLLIKLKLKGLKYKKYFLKNNSETPPLEKGEGERSEAGGFESIKLPGA